MLTKKHFKAIAEIINQQQLSCMNCLVVIENITENLADYFAQENPNFNREKFLNACGIKP